MGEHWQGGGGGRKVGLLCDRLHPSAKAVLEAMQLELVERRGRPPCEGG
jgi:hypothetical protein